MIIVTKSMGSCEGWRVPMLTLMETQLTITKRTRSNRHDSRIFIELASSDLRVLKVKENHSMNS